MGSLKLTGVLSVALFFYFIASFIRGPQLPTTHCNEQEPNEDEDPHGFPQYKAGESDEHDESEPQSWDHP